jgi:hypothetical protein
MVVPSLFGEHVVSRPIFMLTLQLMHDGVDEIRALRFVLKRLLRQYGLRCVTLRELHDNTDQNTRVDTPAVDAACKLGGLT